MLTRSGKSAKAGQNLTDSENVSETTVPGDRRCQKRHRPFKGLNVLKIDYLG